tara:strand:+ start:4061 stop:4795 length:735 start_codon:yes stop_codon:yes gene_type:complete
MDKAEEVIEKNINKTESFISYMFNFDDDTKSIIMNILQYMIVAIVPVVVVLKLIKEYVPEDDDTKNSFEISIEIVIQLGLLFLSIWFIDRLVRYFPTFSKMPYSKSNEMSFIIPLLFIMITMQTKLGAKINILVERGNELWSGNNTLQHDASNNIKSRQPLAQTHQVSRGDTLDSQLMPPPSKVMNPSVDNSTTLINNLPNINNGGQGSNSRYDTEAMNLSLLDGDNEPMAANGLLGGAFGSNW